MKKLFFYFNLLFLLTSCFEYREAQSTDLFENKKRNQFDHFQLDLLFGDFKGLSSETLRTNAIPLKVAVTAIVTRKNKIEKKAVEFKTFEDTLEQYGFISRPEIANLDSELNIKPEFKYPLGLVRGMLETNEPLHTKVEIGNITCAVCHGGRLYDSEGNATKKVWLGLPNTSINLEGYTTEVYKSLKFILSARKEFARNLNKLYPDIDVVERKTIINYLFPEIERQIKDVASKSDQALSFINGPAGNANAIGSFKRVFGIYRPGDFDTEERGYVNIPDMSYRAFKNYLTVDGIYSPLNVNPSSAVTEQEITDLRISEFGKVAAIFPVPVQGVKLERTKELIPLFQKTMTGFVKTYHAPRFPGPVNEMLARQGETVYRQNCMSCHGEYSEFDLKNMRLISYPNKKIALEKIGTDSARVDVITKRLYKKMTESWIPEQLQFSVVKAYVAPILTGLWTTAPYFHNGSVPSVWALMNPELRPKKFYVGGHKLNYTTLGVDYPENYKPFSQPTLVDTELQGSKNTGHEMPFTKLNLEEKKQLLEYLKLL